MAEWDGLKLSVGSAGNRSATQMQICFILETTPSQEIPTKLHPRENQFKGKETFGLKCHCSSIRWSRACIEQEERWDRNQICLLINFSDGPWASWSKLCTTMALLGNLSWSLNRKRFTVRVCSLITRITILEAESRPRTKQRKLRQTQSQPAGMGPKSGRKY